MISFSSTYTLPLYFLFNLPTFFYKVDFPEPELPITEINSPFSTSKVTPLKASTKTLLLIAYLLFRFCTCIYDIIAKT